MSILNRLFKSSRTAEPQPVSAESVMQTGVNQYLRDQLAAANARITQLSFLLSSAPMIDAPRERDRVLASRSPYAYIHPKTFSAVSRFATFSQPLDGSTVFKFGGSPTIWVLTSLMPQDRVIYSPTAPFGLGEVQAA